MNERLDPPEPVEASYDVYLTYHVRVMATSESAAIEEAKDWLTPGFGVSLFDSDVELAAPDPDLRGDALRNGDCDA